MADVRLGDAVNTGGPSWRVLAVLIVELALIIGGFTFAVKYALDSDTPEGPLGTLIKSEPLNINDTDQAVAVSVAQQFVLNSDAFTPKNVNAYVANLMPLMTTKAKENFTKDFAKFQQAVGTLLQQVANGNAAAGTPSVGNVQFAALSTFQGSTASVLVAHDVLYGGVRPAQCAANPDYCQTKRWEVTLRKIDGTWLVDSFNPSI